jgi:hypothetical protein
MTSHSFIRISRYNTSRYWAVWRGAELIAVTVYRKGAQSVADQLQKLQDYENQTIQQHSHPRLVPAA